MTRDRGQPHRREAPTASSPNSRATPPSPRRRHVAAVAAAVAAAAIWSSSFVGVKVLVRDTGPLTVAGFRFFGAFVIMLPWVFRRLRASGVIHRGVWMRLTAIGVSHYTVGNGVLYMALRNLSPTIGSLALCLAPVPVLALGVLRLRERPRPLQFAGVALALAGSVLYFSPGLEAGQPQALAYVAIAVLGVSLGPVLSREIARDGTLNTVVLTALPFGIGGALLMALALIFEGIPRLTLEGWGILLALTVLNTVIAFLLFNHALRHLAAFEANILWNLMPVGTAWIAWGVLGERLVAVQFAAMALIIVGATVVQWRAALRGSAR